MPVPQIQNAGNAFGSQQVPGFTGDDSSTVVQEFAAAVSTILRGDIVALSTSSGFVIRCLTNTAAGLQIGIALAGQLTVGGVVPVVIHGPFKGANKDNTVAVTAGNTVQRSAAVTATALALVNTTAVTQLKDVGTTIGVVMADATAGATTCDIFVQRT